MIESDINLFLLKDGLNKENIRKFELDAMKQLRDIQMNYKTNGIDILSAPTKEIYKKEYYSYKVELLQKGKMWHE